MNITVQGTVSPEQDPLRLSELDDPLPADGTLERDWEAVSAALDAGDLKRRNVWAGGLVSAAAIAVVVALVTLTGPENSRQSPPLDEPLVSQTSPEAGVQPDPGSRQENPQPTTAELIGMSQSMERQLQRIRSEVGAMPSNIVVYQVELQDLIGQVDDALSLSPDSRTLWGQRVELQMDLMKLYRNQLRRDYHRLASV